MATECKISDSNNNFTPALKGYSLRPRATRKCDQEEVPPDLEEWHPPSRTKRKSKSLPLSKYRRKTANARERSRMREINEAFESLRRVIPHVSVEESSNSEKLTKITTLRLAMKYISALDNVLHDQDLESDGESLFSDYTLSLTPPEPVANLFPSDLCDNSSYVFDVPFFSDFS